MLLVMRPFNRLGGGIGNYLFHLCHCILQAQIVQGTLLIPRPLAYRTLNDRAVALDFATEPSPELPPPVWWDGSDPPRVPRSYDPDRIELIGSLLAGNELTREFSFRYRYHCMQEHVRPLFLSDARHTKFDDDTLVIHIRSGDIFEAEPNHKYAQPPLSFYEMLIERRGYRNVVVVTQENVHHGGHNPVIAEIRRRWPQVEFISIETEHDFHTLRHARHLALSSSTFANAAAMLNTGLRTLHVPVWERPYDLNISEPFPPGDDLGFTCYGYQIRGYEEMRDWRNAPEQISLMLEHQIDDIEVA